MINRRAAVRAGRKLNELVNRLGVRTPENLSACRPMTDKEVSEVAGAVRVANEIIFQYNNIPKDVREFWWTGYEEVSEGGVPVQDLPEE